MDRMKAPAGVFDDDEDYESSSEPPADENDDDMGESDLPPDFKAHAQQALGTDDPSRLQALYDAIASCGGGGGEGHHGGLDVVIGLGKGKRR